MSATERVVLLMTKSQKAALKRCAAAARISVSEYVRQTALAETSEVTLLQSMMQTAEVSIGRAKAALDIAFANMASRAARRDAARLKLPQKRRNS